MEIIEKLIRKYGYKFPKGYLDPSSPEDINLFNSLIEGMLKEDDMYNAIQILKSKIGFGDENFAKISSKKYKILVPRTERFDYIEKISKLKDFNFDPNAPGSSTGAIKYKTVTFVVKPDNSQGRSSAGTGNEDIIVDELNKYLEDGPKTIKFKGENKTYTVKNINKVESVGYDTQGGKKADIILKGKKDYPISIKKDNAGFWESSDSRYRELVNALFTKIQNGGFAPQLTFKPFLDKLGNKKKGIYTMYNKETKSKVSGVIVLDLPESEEELIIFGSDNSVVIYKTYSPQDFTLKGDTIYVEVSKVLENMVDIEEYDLEPLLNIRHDSTRNITGGLRATVVPKKQVYPKGDLSGNKIELTYKEIMK